MAQALQSGEAELALGLIPSLETGFSQQTLCTCCRHYPGAAAGWMVSLGRPAVSAFPRKGHRVGLRIVLFEACSAFTRVTACTLALSPIRNTLIEGFSHFVTSMTAPIASSLERLPDGACTHWKRRLFTAHTRCGHWAKQCVCGVPAVLQILYGHALKRCPADVLLLLEKKLGA